MWGIGLFPGEKRSFYRFLAIYIASTLFLILVGEYFYYTYAIHKIEDKTLQHLRDSSGQILFELKKLHQSFDPVLQYPQIEGVRSAIYDIEKNYIIGDFRPQKVNLDKEFYRVGDTYYLVTKVYPHYLGAAYLVVAAPIDKKAIKELYKELALFTLFSIVVIAITAYFLGRIFLAPIRQTVALLDNFIKDATHELNTPISTIVTNIELFKEFHPNLAKSEELQRIETAANRLSKIFSDLSFLQLHHNLKKEIKPHRIDRILHERIAYFEPLLHSKNLTLATNIVPVELEVDRSDMETLFDNLISNAIKYTPPDKRITITLNPEKFVIEDEGVGIDPKALTKITRRFFRANMSEGGFGLGLAIVKKICDYYGCDLKITSRPDHGTRVEVRWKR